MVVRRLGLFLLAGTAISSCGTTTVAAPANASRSYSATVLADLPAAYWRMAEMTGTTMSAATKNGNNGHYDGIVMLAQPGPLTGEGSTAVAFDGSTAAAVVPSSTKLQVNWV